MNKLHKLGIVLTLCMPLMALSAQAPTPVPVQLATSTSLPVLGGQEQSAQPSPTPAPSTPAGAFLEAQTEANVRADASTDAERLGLIAPGEIFEITGRYFRWLQFRYPNAPGGLAWVYDELVTVTGDQSLIPDLSEAPPSIDPLLQAQTQTAGAILAVPGGDLTATAGARILDGPVGVDGSTTQPESALNPLGESRLPTFTPAPNAGQLMAQAVVQPSPTAAESFIDRTVIRGALPPMIPIVALVGFGMLGLIASFLRR
jgi:hypothetical protein